MLPGRGTGERRRTPERATPFPALAAASILGLYGVPVLDHARDQVARVAMRQVLNRVGDVDDGVALHHAQTEIVEIAKLHLVSPPSNTFLATLAADIDTGQPP